MDYKTLCKQRLADPFVSVGVQMMQLSGEAIGVCLSSFILPSALES